MHDASRFDCLYVDTVFPRGQYLSLMLQEGLWRTTVSFSRWRGQTADADTPPKGADLIPLLEAVDGRQ